MHSIPPFSAAVDPRTRTIRLSGEVDMSAAPTLANLVDDQGEVSTVDLAEVTFLDTTVLNFLVGLDVHLQACGDRLNVVGAAPRIRRVFALSGLTHLLGDRDDTAGSAGE